MSYILKGKLAATGNYGGDRTAKDIRYLVIHYTGNDGDSAANNAAYFQNHVVKASAHYFVDDTTVYRSVPDLKVAWAVGGRLYSDVKKTGGGSMYGVITNRNSISVEFCDTARDSTHRASESTLINAITLCRNLMEQYQIPLSHVYRHFDVTGKHCPRYFMDETAWKQFKTRLEESPVSQEQFDKLMENWLHRQAAKEASPVSEHARQWAESLGIISGFSDGSKQYKAFCTREQVAIMLHRIWSALNS